jgi:hypothetical protein
MKGGFFISPLVLGTLEICGFIVTIVFKSRIICEKLVELFSVSCNSSWLVVTTCYSSILSDDLEVNTGTSS